MLDRLTQLAAAAVARRRFLGGALGVAAALVGGRLLDPPAVWADYCGYCNGPCTNDYSQTGSPCCSPHGTFCVYDFVCTCSCGAGAGNCGCYYPYMRVCDSGGNGSGFCGCGSPCWC